MDRKQALTKTDISRLSSAELASKGDREIGGFRGVGHMQSTQVSRPGVSEGFMLSCDWPSPVLFCATDVSPPGSGFRPWSTTTP